MNAVVNMNIEPQKPNPNAKFKYYKSREGFIFRLFGCIFRAYF